jgi:sterol desaturase/sphingolipid hydroxylase (fatty acid hydroxylase superfamily)
MNLWMCSACLLNWAWELAQLKATLTHWRVKNEATIRLACFIGVLALMAIGELLWAKRRRPARDCGAGQTTSRSRFLSRTNRSAGGSNRCCLHRGKTRMGTIEPFFASGVMTVTASVLVLELAIYAQHWVFHHVPLLWRLPSATG